MPIAHSHPKCIIRGLSRALPSQPTTLLAGFLTLALPTHLNALPVEDSSQLDPEEVIVTGVYTPQPQTLLTQSITSINQRDIELQAPANTSDLLRTVRGLLVNQQGGMGGSNEVSIRGSESNFVNVYIDGVRVNDPVNTRGGSYNFNALAPNALERVEVLRGANSAIYASGSLGGAVHLITLSPTESSQQSLHLAAGENGYYNASAKLTGRSGNWGYGLRAASLESGSQQEGSDFHSDEAAALLRYDVSEQTFLQLNLRYSDEERQSYPEQSGGPEFATTDLLETGNAEERNARLILHSQLASNWQSEWEISHFHRSSHTRSPGIAPYFSVPPTEDDTQYRRTQWRWNNTLGDLPLGQSSASASSLWINIGLDGEDESGHSAGFVDFGFPIPTNFSLQRDSQGAYVNVNFFTASQWLLQASARYDDPDSSQSETSFQLGVKTPSFFEQLQLSLNWGEAYKLPSFFALAHPLVGNTDLKPELAESWTLDVQWQPTAEFKASLALFDYEYKDLVDFDPQLFQNVNRSSVDTSGAEFEIEWLPRPDTRLRANATYTDIDVADNASKLTGRPAWVASSQLTHQLSDSVETHLLYRWKDEQYAASQHTGSSITETLESYDLLDIKLRWKLSGNTSTFMSINNVTNSRYQEAIGFPGLRRNVRVGLNIDF